MSQKKKRKQEAKMELTFEERLDKVVDLVWARGNYGGDYAQWTLDQILRAALGSGYKNFIRNKTKPEWNDDTETWTHGVEWRKGVDPDKDED